MSIMQQILFWGITALMTFVFGVLAMRYVKRRDRKVARDRHKKEELAKQLREGSSFLYLYYQGEMIRARTRAIFYLIGCSGGVYTTSLALEEYINHQHIAYLIIGIVTSIGVIALLFNTVHELRQEWKLEGIYSRALEIANTENTPTSEDT